MLSWLWNWGNSAPAVNESWVITALRKAVHSVQVVETDLETAATWVFDNFDTIQADVAEIISLAATFGATANPAVATAIAVTEDALSALKAYKTTHDAGGSTVASVASAYNALKQTQAAYANIAGSLVPVPSTGATPLATQTS